MKSCSIATLCGIALLSSNSLATSQTLEQSKIIEKSITAEAAKGQQSIDSSYEKSLQLEAEIASLKAEVDSLEVYRNHLQGMIKNQDAEIESFDEQLNAIEGTRKSIVPLMYNMLDGLETHIAQDRPIRLEARLKRVQKLQDMMTKADISDAEKYRRLLEAYQIELDYGTKLGSYKGLIEVEGQAIEAEQLYLGRLSLVARSSNRQHYWAWDAKQQSWQVQGNQVALDIDKAFNLANKQAAPTLLNLPVSVNQTQEHK
jgi:septal ring factor EnvC (AmiA/AmiB activator)